MITSSTLVRRFPAAMAATNRWGLWIRKEQGDHTSKLPYSPITGYYAKSNDPATWCTYDQARTAYHQAEAKFGGPAFFTGGGWCLLDLDHIDYLIANYNLGETNLISQLLDLLDDTYCEYSQSRSGLHFIFKIDRSVTRFGQHEKKLVNDKSRELYHSKRFIALTGVLLNPSQPNGITTINQQQWSQLYELVFQEPLTNASTVDAQPLHIQHQKQLSPAAKKTINLILQGNNHGDDARLNRWLNTPFYDSTADANAHGVQCDHSAEDLACCNMLAYWTNYDPQLIDEIFRHTQLYRPKWDRMTGNQTYGDMTIAKAINFKRSQLQAWKARQPKIIVKGVTR